MKLLEFNETAPYKGELNKKKAIITVTIILLLVLICTLVILYNTNSSAHDFMDNYLFRKNISSENLPTVDFNSDDVTAIYGYDKYIALLTKNSLTAYSSYGKKEFSIDLAIGTPIAANAGSYIVIGEKGSKKLYLVNGSNIVWQREVEGEITRLSVNKNGYVAVTVIINSTTSKNMVITISPSGTELFYTYFSNSTAIDSSISNDNKYLAVAEISTSENSLQSNVKIISMETALTDATNSVVYIYPANSGEVISRIKYQDNGDLICMYDTSVHKIKDKNDTKLYDISTKKDLFLDINLKDKFTYATEKSSGLFSDVFLEIVDTISQKNTECKLNNVPKSIITNYNIIAVSYGSEIDFINTNGWLLKKYHSSQEVTNIVIGTSIVGIVYKDKIELFGI